MGVRWIDGTISLALDEQDVRIFMCVTWFGRVSGVQSRTQSHSHDLILADSMHAFVGYEEFRFGSIIGVRRSVRSYSYFNSIAIYYNGDGWCAVCIGLHRRDDVAGPGRTESTLVFLCVWHWKCYLVCILPEIIISPSFPVTKCTTLAIGGVR